MLDNTAVQIHRKARLRELIDNAFGGLIARLADRIDRQESYVGRMLYPPGKEQARAVGDKMARHIEEACELPRNWFDQPLGSALPYPLEQSAAPSSGDMQPANEHIGQASNTTVLWPFKLASYRRIQQLTTALGRQSGEAIRDLDQQLDIVLIKWEREAARLSAGKSGKPAA